MVPPLPAVAPYIPVVEPPRAESVEEYLQALPAPTRAALERLRRTIRSVAPQATEAISYRIPTFRILGKPLVGYAGFTNHCSFFPMSSAVVQAHREELAANYAGKGTFHFTPDHPLPVAVVKRIVRERLAEIGPR